MRITKVTVLQNYGTDFVTLYTDYPCPYDVGDEPLCISFSTTKGRGVSYVTEHFGVDPEIPEIIDILDNGMVQKWSGEPFDV